MPKLVARIVSSALALVVSLCFAGCSERIPVVVDTNLNPTGALEESDPRQPVVYPHVQSSRGEAGETVVMVMDVEGESLRFVQVQLPFKSSATSSSVMAGWTPRVGGDGEFATDLRGSVALDRNEPPTPEHPRVLEYDLTGERNGQVQHFRGKVLIKHEDLAALPTVPPSK